MALRPLLSVQSLFFPRCEDLTRVVAYKTIVLASRVKGSESIRAILEARFETFMQMSTLTYSNYRT